MQGCLRSFLGEVRDEYDAVLIDCPPNLELCSWAALLASDNLVIPLNPEDFGAQGIAEVLDAVDLVLAGPEPPAAPGRLPRHPDERQGVRPQAV